jgi:hypothetical protein
MLAHVYALRVAGPRIAFTTAVVVLAAVSLSGSASGHTSAFARVVVTAAGQIGPLHIDESGRVDVIAFAGQPEAERRGRYASYAPFDALGYGCDGKPATDSAGLPMCQTVFYLDTKSGRLELFYTEDAHYSNLRGVHVGTTTAAAEALMQRLAISGCLDGLRVETKTGFLFLEFTGGNGRVHHHPYYLHVVGGHVGFMVVHSKRLNPGVLDCIDS